MTAPDSGLIDWSLPLPRVLHGTSVSVGGAAALLVGPSGAGKSTMALQLMSLGAGLISDDLTQLRERGGRVLVSCPTGQKEHFGIEARGLGLLRARRAEAAALHVIVDMSQTEAERLPMPRYTKVSECSIRTISHVEHAAFPAMLMQLLRLGFLEDWPARTL